MLLFAELDAAAIAPCAFVGGAAAIVVWWVLRALSADDIKQGDEWAYDISRINELRRLDPFYRLFRQPIQVLAKLNRAAFANSLPEIRREIQAAGLPRYWLPEEYLARAELIGLLMGPFYALVCFHYMGVEGFITAAVLVGVTIWLLRRRLTKQAKRRLVKIKRRLPFLLDLMTLLMEAGSSFLQALKQGVLEFEGHPVSTEFGRVLTDMNMGKARVEAFDNLRRRLNDDEITAIVGAILQSEELGTPLSAIFRTQADVLSLKRSQRAETIAGEAGVNMLLPGILIMASAILIMLGPFILSYLYSGLNL